MKSASERAPEGKHAWLALKQDSYTIQLPCLGLLCFSKEVTGMPKTQHQDKCCPKIKLNGRFRILSRMRISRFPQNIMKIGKSKGTLII